jgi:O-antigen/teichoic acid export membrane protein
VNTEVMADPQPGPPSPAARSAVGQLAGRLGSHSAVYLLRGASSLVAGVVSVIVLTRYLEPREFGRLAVLLVVASILALLYNLGSLQGTLSWVYGAADDDTGMEEADGRSAGAQDRRRALATGLLLTAGAGALGTAVLLLVSEPAADILVDDPDSAKLVVIAGIAAAVAAVWRLASNALRLERRPWSYVASAATQHHVGLAFAIVLLATGRGIEGILLGIAGGNLVALGLTLVLVRRSVRLPPSLNDGRAILHRGRAAMPLVASIQTIQLADVLLLSRFVPATDVGLYRVANRIGAVVSYWTASFHMAWGSLRSDPLHVAADNQRGRAQVAALVATYFLLATTGAVLAAALLADEVIRLAAPEYRDAAGLIPLTATGFALQGIYVLAYRSADFPRRRSWFVACSVACALVFAGSAPIWISALGAAGAAAAVMSGWTVGICGMLWKGQRGPRPVPFPWLAIGGGLAIAAACLGGALAIGSLPSVPQLLVDVAALVAYPTAIVAAGIVPPAHVRLMLLSLRREDRGGVALDVDDRSLIYVLLRARVPPKEVARVNGVSESEILRRLVMALRRSGGGNLRHDWDAALGAFVLFDGSFAEREDRARALFREGADPVDVDRVSRTADQLKRRRPEQAGSSARRRAPRKHA